MERDISRVSSNQVFKYNIDRESARQGESNSLSVVNNTVSIKTQNYYIFALLIK